MSISDTPFEIDVDVAALTITPRGEIDMATAGAFSDAIHELAAGSPDGQLVIDFANVEFIDSSGVRVLVHAWENTRRIVIRNPKAQALRLLALTGIDNILPIENEADGTAAAPND